MPLSDYNELIVSAQEWLIRVGLQELVDFLPEAVVLTEEDMKNRLRIRQLKYRAQADHNEEYEWLPDDYADMQSVKILHKEDSNGRRLETPVNPLTNAQFDRMPFIRSSSFARNYTILGKQIRFRPVPTPIEDGTPDAERPKFELVYYAKDNPLTAASPTNEILAVHPSLYLWGTLANSGQFLREKPEWIGKWESNYEGAMVKANEASKESEQSGPTARSAPG